MLRKALLVLFAAILVVIHTYFMAGPKTIVNFFHYSDMSVPVGIAQMIVEEVVTIALYSAPFAAVIGFIYRRSWLPLTVVMTSLSTVLRIRNYPGLLHTSGFLHIVDYTFSMLQYLFLLPLLTWIVTRVLSYYRVELTREL